MLGCNLTAVKTLSTESRTLSIVGNGQQTNKLPFEACNASAQMLKTKGMAASDQISDAQNSTQKGTRQLNKSPDRCGSSLCFFGTKLQRASQEKATHISSIWTFQMKRTCGTTKTSQKQLKATREMSTVGGSSSFMQSVQSGNTNITHRRSGISNCYSHAVLPILLAVDVLSQVCGKT